MSVAVVSILASSAVALASLASGYLQHRSRLKHENQLSFETRSWDLKAQAHFEIIRIITALREIADRPITLASKGPEAIGPLKDQQAVVYLYGTEWCQERLLKLILYLESIEREVDTYALTSIPKAQRQVNEAIRESDYEAAKEFRDLEVAAVQSVISTLEVNHTPQDLRTNIDLLAQAVRESLGLPPHK